MAIPYVWRYRKTAPGVIQAHRFLPENVPTSDDWYEMPYLVPGHDKCHVEQMTNVDEVQNRVVQTIAKMSEKHALADVPGPDIPPYTGENQPKGEKVKIRKPTAKKPGRKVKGA